jgi:hypothetical protein
MFFWTEGVRITIMEIKKRELVNKLLLACMLIIKMKASNFS